jgi:2-polyprenyl-6-methoxyphenol hydroxylase-like FAD-dependent oxidoreductase
MPIAAETGATASPVEIEADVVILGAGASGCAAAAAISRAGHRVVMVDLHRIYPSEFRAEKFGERQFAYMSKFGLGPAGRENLTRFEGVWLYNYGRIVDRLDKPEYSLDYGDFVNGLRRALPAEVTLLFGKVQTMATGADRQELTLADGTRITARLLVLATGLIDVARRALGIDKRVISEAHSLIFGFDLAQPPAAFPFPSLVWYLDRPADRGAYLALFPIKDRMRANLFTYKKLADPWVKACRADPAAALHALIPDFERHFGRLDVAGPVAARPVDLIRTENFLKPGVVLIGDAFMTTCPTTGTGIDRAFGDVDALIRHLPGWLATPGMDVDKLAAFYADPAKTERDMLALRSSFRDRAMRMNVGFVGRARRIKHIVQVRGGYEWRTLTQAVRHVARLSAP